MKRIRVLLTALMIGSVAASFSMPLQAQGNTNGSAKLVRDIQENAAATASNATIYQWKRVNLEVDRIVADFRKLPTIQQSEELKQTVQELRSARTNRNRDHVVAAAQRLSTLVSHL